MEDQTTQVFYVPSEGGDWRLIEMNDNLKVEEDQVAFTNGVADLYRNSRFLDHSKINNNFNDLIDSFNLSALTTEEPTHTLSESIGESPNENWANDQENTNPITDASSNRHALLQTINDCYLRGVWIGTAARRNQVDVEEAKKSLFLFQRNLKLIRHDNRRFLNKTT